MSEVILVFPSELQTLVGDPTTQSLQEETDLQLHAWDQNVGKIYMTFKPTLQTVADVWDQNNTIICDDQDIVHGFIPCAIELPYCRHFPLHALRFSLKFSLKTLCPKAFLGAFSTNLA